MSSGEFAGETSHSVIENTLGEIQRIPDPAVRLHIAIELMRTLPDVISNAQDEIADRDSYKSS